MQAQSFMPAQEAFNRAAEQARPEPAPLIPTPYTALSIQPQMRDALATTLRRVYTVDDKANVVAACRYGANLEPITDDDLIRVKATAGVDNRNGLQIVLCEVNGQPLRKDKIPYHMIWSHDPAIIDFPVIDQDYTWPVTEMDDPRVYKDERGYLQIAFDKVTTHDMPYTRVLSRIELMAEELAVSSYKRMNSEWLHQYNAPDYDIMNLERIPLRIPSADGTCYKTPDFIRVQHHASGGRFGYTVSY